MLQGRCFCGFVTYEVHARPFGETNCHCSICRKTTGAPFVAWFTVPIEAFRFACGEPSFFSSSEHARRTFCPRCGTALTFASDKTPDQIDITTCSLDDPSELAPKAHIHTSSKLPWVHLLDDLPTFSGELPS